MVSWAGGGIRRGPNKMHAAARQGEERARAGRAKSGRSQPSGFVSTELREQLQQTLGAAYHLERELGGGGMSRVFVAVETALGRNVAAGVSIDRFRREIQLAAQLQHPHIVPAGLAAAVDPPRTRTSSPVPKMNRSVPCGHQRQQEYPKTFAHGNLRTPAM